MITLIIISLIYVLSVYFGYKCIQYSVYHEKGRWKGLTTNNTELIMIFTPIINLILTIEFLIGNWRDERYRKSNFFEPKKPLK